MALDYEYFERTLILLDAETLFRLLREDVEQTEHRLSQSLTKQDYREYSRCIGTARVTLSVYIPDGTTTLTVKYTGGCGHNHFVTFTTFPKHGNELFITPY